LDPPEFGLFTLFPTRTITYEKIDGNKGGGLGQDISRYLHRGLGRPDIDSKSDIDKLSEFFTQSLETAIPEIKSVLVFTDKRVDLQVEDAPIPAMVAEGLKEFIRKQAKEKPMPGNLIVTIKAILPKEEKPVKSEVGK
jgi:hypothetical protein